MSRHNAMPPVPAANRSNKGTGDHSDVKKVRRLRVARCAVNQVQGFER